MARPPKNIERVVTEMSESTATAPQNVLREPDFDEGVVPASATSRTATRLGLDIIAPLTKFGAKQAPEYKVIPDTIKPHKPAGDTPEPMKDVLQDDPAAPLDVPEAEVAKPNDPAPEEIKVKKPEPVSVEELEERMATREEYFEGPRTSPSGKGEGVVEGAYNTRFYTDDGLAATVQTAVKASGEDYKSRTVQSFYDRALMSGVPKRMLDNIFKGIPMESKVGNHKLAEEVAGLQILHDISAKRLDELMVKAAANELDEAGKLELREAVSQHQIIFDQLSGVKRDVARTMNVFKNVYEKETPSAVEVRTILDSFGGDEQLRAFAEKYVTTQSRAGKNTLLEHGLGKKTWDAIIYHAQAMYLTNWKTHVRNTLSGTLMIATDLPDRLTAAAIVSPLRQTIRKMMGRQVDPDRARFIDIAARASGFVNGILDGVQLAGYYLKNGKAGYKSEGLKNPISADYFSNTPVRILGRELFRIGELEGKPLGKIINALGVIPAIPMKAIGVVDEMIGGTAQRMELNYQAYKLQAQKYWELIDEGVPHEEAYRQAQEGAGILLSERPADVEASMQSWRKQVTMQDEIDRTNIAGKAWHTFNKSILNWLPIKLNVLFTQSTSNIAIEGAARTPILNFLSPRFYTEINKGGASKDVAIARVINGGALLTSGALMSGYLDRFTGNGPTDTEDRSTLRSLGWQPLSFKFGKDELSSANIERLRAIEGITITEGSGEFDGVVFMSVKGIEPATMPFMLGAVMADALRYSAYDDRNTFAQTMWDAGSAVLAEFSTSAPAMQGLAEMLGIANQSQTDTGDKLVAMMDKYVEQTGTNLVAGLPGLGYTNSALAGYIETMLNPGAEPTAVTQDQVDWAEDNLGVDITNPGLRGFFMAYNKWMSRVPIYNKDAPVLVDEWGDPIMADKSYAWSITRTSEGKPNEAKELVSSIHHGLSRPQYNIGGVYLPQEAQERYKTLYAKEIKIDGRDMSQAIVYELEEMITEYEMANAVPMLGDLQAVVDNVVNEYRAAARERMFGKTVKTPDGMKIFTMEGVGSQYGFVSDKVEFPELAIKMEKADLEARVYGR